MRSPPGREALRHATESDHIDLQISARYFLGAAHHSIGRYKDAADVFLKAITLIGNRRHEHFGYDRKPLRDLPRLVGSVPRVQLGDLTEAMPFAGTNRSRPRSNTASNTASDTLITARACCGSLKATITKPSMYSARFEESAKLQISPYITR